MACLFVLLLSLGGGSLVDVYFGVGNGLMYLYECVKFMAWVWSCMMGSCYGFDGVMLWV